RHWQQPRASHVAGARSWCFAPNRAACRRACRRDRTGMRAWRSRYRYTRAPLMKLAPWLLLFSLLASCGSVRNWRELQTEPMSIGEAWNGFVDIATARDGWRVDE